MIELPCNPS